MAETLVVTGGCGFVGATLVPALVALGHRVRVVDNLCRGFRSFLDGTGAELIEADIRDRAALDRAFADADRVLHLAAFGSVPESVADPEPNFDMNVVGTLTVLQAAAAAGVRRVIFASTGGALIGEAPPPVNEDSVPRPISPYGASKLCGEAYCCAYAGSFELDVAILRFANVYGPYSAHKTGAVTQFAKALLRGEPMEIYGDGRATRDFLHIDDLVAGIRQATWADLAPGTVLHLASGEEISVGHVAASLARAAGRPDHPIVYRPARAGEVTRNAGDYSKAARLLGFAPRRSFEAGIAETWRWFEANREHVLATGETAS